VAIAIDRLDHLVLTVRDIAATVDFYARVLGMTPVTFGGGRTALRFGDQKINLHRAGAEIDPKAARPTPGSADLCLVTPAGTAQVIAHLEAEGVAVVEGPVARTGAVGPIESVYFRDPDGNLIEVARYAEGT
jgi:catechol 2,3-dioxygenase-like lactoylglutathione lyase family enzyme